LTQGNWTVRFGISDGLNFVTPNAGPAFLVPSHEDVKGCLGVPLWLAPFILLPLAIFQTFWLDHPQWLLFPCDDLIDLA
jgi:hypothetical protein